MSPKLRGSLMLLLTAVIWGVAFVAQSDGMNYVGPFTYGGIRMLVGAIVLVPVTLVFRRLRPYKRYSTRKTVIAGICSGLVLFCASSIQQIAIAYTTAGKAGFITALYIVIVPIIQLILYRSAPKSIWLCALIAIAGFYFLCIKDGFSVSRGDLLMLLCAVFFACHIITIDHFIEDEVDGVMMSCVQFWVAGTLGIIFMFIFEEPDINSILAAKGTILYAGLMSSGAAYTLQILGQGITPPTVATMLMSLESVFAALSGALILGEKLTIRELFGCILVFAAVILAQITIPNKQEK